MVCMPRVSTLSKMGTCVMLTRGLPPCSKGCNCGVKGETVCAVAHSGDRVAASARAAMIRKVVFFIAVLF